MRRHQASALAPVTWRAKSARPYRWDPELEGAAKTLVEAQGLETWVRKAASTLLRMCAKAETTLSSHCSLTV